MAERVWLQASFKTRTVVKQVFSTVHSGKIWHAITKTVENGAKISHHSADCSWLCMFIFLNKRMTALLGKDGPDQFTRVQITIELLLLSR